MSRSVVDLAVGTVDVQLPRGLGRRHTRVDRTFGRIRVTEARRIRQFVQRVRRVLGAVQGGRILHVLRRPGDAAHVLEVFRSPGGAGSASPHVGRHHGAGARGTRPRGRGCRRWGRRRRLRRDAGRSTRNQVAHAQRRLHQRSEARPLGLVDRRAEHGYGCVVRAGTVFAFEQRAVELPKDDVGSPRPRLLLDTRQVIHGNVQRSGNSDAPADDQVIAHGGRN